jgi:hypothetical protein
MYASLRIDSQGGHHAHQGDASHHHGSTRRRPSGVHFVNGPKREFLGRSERTHILSDLEPEPLTESESLRVSPADPGSGTAGAYAHAAPGG